MKVITVTHPKTNAPFEIAFGRKRPVAEGPHMRLAHYLQQALPTPPTSVSYWTPACDVALRDIYANDERGDCVVASRYHGVATATGNAGDLYHATKAAIIKTYSAIGGYVPGQPSTDQGLDEVTSQAYWLKNGFLNGTKPLGYVAVDASNWTEVQTAIWLFEGADICMELPDAWISPFPSGDGFVWDAATPDEENGHCIQATGYSTSGVEIDTWGLKGTLTKAALAKLAVAKQYGSFYVVLTPDLVAKGATKAPCGVAWNDLVADFNALGGSVPVPAPAPAPPAPSPTGAVTLAQAQAWARAGIAAGAALQTRASAEGNAANALATNWPKS